MSGDLTVGTDINTILDTGDTLNNTGGNLDK